MVALLGLNLDLSFYFPSIINAFCESNTELYCPTKKSRAKLAASIRVKPSRNLKKF
jgi:hypothetical protein